MKRVYFNETQRFRQWFIYLAVVASMAAWIYMISASVHADEPDKKVEDHVLILTGIIPLILIVLLFSLRLVTRIRDDGIYIRFKPFQWKEKHIRKEDIKSFEVRKYKPIMEYGGWGYRNSLRKYGRAYNVSGNMGLQLYLGNGNKLLIGTQKPREIQKAMDALMGKERSEFIA